MSTLPSSVQNPFSNRHARLAQVMQQAGLDAIAVNPGPTLIYLTGMIFHLSERPTLALFFPHRDPILILPRLEMAKLDALPFPLTPFAFGDDPQTWGEVFSSAINATGLTQAKIGVEPTRLRFLEQSYLQNAAPQLTLIPAAAAFASLRMLKDAEEVTRMQRAVEIAQTALTQTLPLIQMGMMEREIASELTLQLLRAGSEPELPFSPIISTGPNSANPHAFPSERRLAQGDLLVIDWGAAYQGYYSDLTRTFAVGEVIPEFAQIAAVVKDANAAGRAAVRPGVLAGSVDAAARAVIEKAGYGQAFIHRTGHGLGMEGHEEPYIYGENKLLLTPGMTFTVEPGIYLAGRAGVRIEDNVVVTADGVETLSSMPRELRTVGV